MRRFFNIILFVPILVFAQNRSYNISFNLSDFEFVLEDSVLQIKSNKSDYTYCEDTRLAALPYFAYSISIPYGSKVNDFDATYTKELIYEDVYITSNPQNFPTNQINAESEVLHSRAISSTLKPCTFGGNHIMNGVRFSNFAITPFYYDYETRKLYFISNICLTLFCGSNNLTDATITDVNLTNPLNICDFVINKDELHAFYSNMPQSKITESPDPTVYDYLIITNSELKNSLKKLVDWKSLKGLKTKIITTEEIYDTYPVVSSGPYPPNENQIKIKKCIQEHKNNGTGWVLFVGDDSVVPVQECLVKTSPTYEESSEFSACDLFYACFDGSFDWNANSNNIIGEVSDNVDYYPDIVLSRIPVRTVEQLCHVVDKILVYEKRPQKENYIKKILMAGKALTNSTFNGKSDAHANGEYMYANYVQPYWDGTKKYMYDTGNNISDTPLILNRENLLNELQNGYHFFHMDTHGSYDNWVLMYNHFNKEDATSLNKSSIVITSACFTNQFNHEQECLSEAFMRNPNGGAIAYWGSSVEGWGYKNGTFGPSDLYNSFVLEGIFSGNLLFNKWGMICNNARIRCAHNIGAQENTSIYRWLLFSVNPLGDPEMDVYTENPLKFENVVIRRIDSTTVMVSTGGIDSCSIALTSFEDGNNYSLKKDFVDSNIFYDVPENFNVVITKHNYIPYVFMDTLYLQNEIIDTDATFNANTIIIGYDVNPNDSPGNVVIKDGAHVIFNYAKEFIVKSGFECKEGSSFEIEKATHVAN